MRTRISRILATGVVAFLVTGCGPSLGEAKSEADAQVATMQGLSEVEASEFRWRIESAGESETVKRIVAEAETANHAGIDAQEDRAERVTAALEPWLDVPLVVTWPPQGHQSLVNEVLTLKSEGSLETTAGLASQWADPTTWEVVEHPTAVWIQICGQTCLKWVVKDAGGGQVRLVAPVEDLPSQREGETWLLVREGAGNGS